MSTTRFEDTFPLEMRKSWAKEIYNRIKGIYNLSSDDELVQHFNLPIGSPANNKTRGKVPFDLAYLVSVEKNLGFNFVLTGKESDKLDVNTGDLIRKGVINGLLLAVQANILDGKQALDINFLNSFTDLIMETITNEQIKRRQTQEDITLKKNISNRIA